ncbi:unnamed protein product [Ixodes persulcatus]
MIPVRRHATAITTSKPHTSGEKKAIPASSTSSHHSFPPTAREEPGGPAPSPHCPAKGSAALLRRAKVGTGRVDTSLGRISPHNRECSWIVFRRPGTLSATRYIR